MNQVTDETMKATYSQRAASGSRHQPMQQSVQLHNSLAKAVCITQRSQFIYCNDRTLQFHCVLISQN